MPQHLLLTGATGQVGRYLVRDLLLKGQPLAVLLRPRGDQTARDRLEGVLGHWERELGRPLPRPVCLEGDVTLPGLGLDAATRRWAARHCDVLLHNAASLSFAGADRNKDPWLTNLTGSAHVLEFCRQTGIGRLHYVSTAYVCGKRSGVIYEDELDRGQDFRNDYERCKCEAEKRVRAADFLESLTVYRPAVIVGDSRTGYTAAYNGLYPYLQFPWLVGQFAPRDADGRWHAPVRINLTGDERRNLVPIDWVSAVLTHMLLRPEWHGRTYHLTPRQPVTARTIEEAMAANYGYYGPRFVGPEALARGPLNELEKHFYQYVETYQPYWHEEPIFDAAHTAAAAPHLPCPVIDVPFLTRLIQFAVSDRWGKGVGKRERAGAGGK
jgi:nucleoside-diphosphate-sugar epimerase